MKLYFVRHGETSHNNERRTTGHADISLSEKGIEQVKDLAKELPKSIDVILSSDLIRCKQTADILARSLNLEVEYDARLRERNFGSLEGVKIDELPKGLWDKDINQEYDYRPYGGESVEDVKARLFSVLKDIELNYKDKSVLVVAHGGIGRLLYRLHSGEIVSKIHNSQVYEFDIPIIESF